MNTDQQRVARIEARLLQVAGQLTDSPVVAERERQHLAHVASAGRTDPAVSASEARLYGLLESGMANTPAGSFLLSRYLPD